MDQILELDLIKSYVLAVQLLTSFVLSLISLGISAHLSNLGLNNTSSSGSVSSAQLNNFSLNDTGLFNSSASAAAIVSLVVFGVGAIAYSIGAIVCGRFVCRKGEKCKPILTAIGGLFYFIGNNLPPLVEEYEQQLSCGQGCVEGFQQFGVVMLALAVITYLPIMVGGVVQSEDKDEGEKSNVHANVFLLLSKITDLDLVYTTIERVIHSDCPDERAVIGAWLYYTFFITAFLLLLLGTLTIDFIQRKMSLCPDFILGLFNSILIFVCLACYILVDNQLPLACSGLVRDNPLAQSIFRLVVWSIALAIAVYGQCYSLVVWRKCTSTK